MPEQPRTARRTQNGVVALYSDAARSNRLGCSIDELVPGVEEQIAIADLICDMYPELSALESRNDTIRAPKQAMTQDRLTGRNCLV